MRRPLRAGATQEPITWSILKGHFSPTSSYCVTSLPCAHKSTHFLLDFIHNVVCIPPLKIQWSAVWLLTRDGTKVLPLLGVISLNLQPWSFQKGFLPFCRNTFRKQLLSARFNNPAKFHKDSSALCCFVKKWLVWLIEWLACFCWLEAFQSYRATTQVGAVQQ